MSGQPMTRVLVSLVGAAVCLAIVALAALEWESGWSALVLAAGMAVALAVGYIAGHTRGSSLLPWIVRGIDHLAVGTPPEPCPKNASRDAHRVAAAFEHASDELERRSLDGVLSREQALFDGRHDALESLAAGLAGRFGQALAGARTALANVERAVRAEGAPGDRALASDLDSVRRALEQAAALVAGLRAVAPARERPPEPVSLEDAVRRAVEDRRARAARLGVRIDLETPPFELPVPAEAAVLTGTVGPLIDNALDALEDRGGRVVIRIEAPTASPEITVVVEDDGPGLTAAALERAFDPFFTTRAAADGLGLGLVFARAAAAKCGGTLEIDNATAGGARALFRIPRPTRLRTAPVPEGGRETHQPD